MILLKKIRHRIILVLNKRRIKCQRRCAWRNMMFYIFGKIVQKGLFYYDNEASIDPLLRQVVAFRFICLLSLLFFFFYFSFFEWKLLIARKYSLGEKQPLPAKFERSRGQGPYKFVLSKDFHARKLYVDWKSEKCSLKIIFYFILVISLKIIHSYFTWSLMNRRNYLQILRHWIQHILDQWSQYKHEKQTRDFTVLIGFQKLFCFRLSYLWQWCVEGTTLQYLYFYVFVINKVTRR